MTHAVRTGAAPNDGLPRHLGTPDEVAAHLGVPVATLYAWRTRHKGPVGVRVGKHLRYRWPDVDLWVADQTDGARE